MKNTYNLDSGKPIKLYLELHLIMCIFGYGQPNTTVIR